MIYYLILLHGIPESYGTEKTEKEFQDKKELLKIMGCEVKKVSKIEYERIKKKIDFENFINRRCFKIITSPRSGGETM
jgi:hypothetical protein